MPDAPAEPTVEAPQTPADAPAQETATDWKAEARKWEQRAKENAAKLKEAAPKLTEYEQMVQANKSEAERQAEATARWQTEAETWRSAAVGSRIEALAALDFEYPADAVTRLDASKYLDAGGQINEDAIRADLAALLEERPTWRRQDGAAPSAPRVPAPNRAQGSSGSAAPADPAAAFAAVLQGQLSGPR